MGLGEKYGHVMCPLSKLPLQTQAFFQITLHAKQCQQQGTARAPQARPTAPLNPPPRTRLLGTRPPLPAPSLCLDQQIWLTWKDWRQKEKAKEEDKMVRQHLQFNRHELEQPPGDSEGQRSLACCSPWVAKSRTWLSNWTTTGFLGQRTLPTICPQALPLCWLLRSQTQGDPPERGQDTRTHFPYQTKMPQCWVHTPCETKHERSVTTSAEVNLCPIRVHHPGSQRPKRAAWLTQGTCGSGQEHSLPAWLLLPIYQAITTCAPTNRRRRGPGVSLLRAARATTGRPLRKSWSPQISHRRGAKTVLV